MSIRTFIQGAHGSDGGGTVTTITVTFGSPTTAGSLIVFQSVPGVDAIVSVTDNASPPNTYKKVLTVVAGGATNTIWYAFNTKPCSNITGTYATGDFSGGAFAEEYSGLVGEVDPSDNGSGASGNSTLADTGSFTAAQADETCVLYVNTSAGGADNSSHGFTLRYNPVFGTQVVKDADVGPGSVDPQSDVNSGVWLAMAWSFKAPTLPAPAGGALLTAVVG